MPSHIPAVTATTLEGMSPRADAAELVRVARVSHSFSGVPALEEVSLSFRKGEVHALLGANGAGKSTLVRIISGALRPTHGRLLIAGEPHAGMTPRSADAAGIRTIYQEFTLVPQMSVGDNIFLGREPHRSGFLRRRQVRSATRELLADIEADIDPDATVAHLSIAQQQQVEIAKALSGAGSRLLIMDEPTSGLTQREVDSLFRLIRRLRDRGAGIVFISHRIDEVMAIADRATVLRDGRVAGSTPVAQTDRQALARMIVGQARSEELAAEEGAGKADAPRHQGVQPVLSVNDVSNAYLKHVSFDLRAGEVLGVFGLVGSGRTRLARLLYGLDPAETGVIRVVGREVRVTSPRVAIAQGMGLVPEDRKQSSLVMPMDALGNVTLAALSTFSTVGLWLRKSEELKAYMDIRSRLGIKAASPFTAVGTLSGGNQQKICFARWLLRECRILILDEPTRGVDIGAKSEIYAEILRLAGEGRAILVMSSEAQEMTALSDRTLVMFDGWIKQELSVKQGDEHRLLLAAGSKVGVL